MNSESIALILKYYGDMQRYAESIVQRFPQTSFNGDDVVQEVVLELLTKDLVITPVTAKRFLLECVKRGVKQLYRRNKRNFHQEMVNENVQLIMEKWEREQWYHDLHQREKVEIEETLLRAAEGLPPRERLVFTFLMNNAAHVDIGRKIREMENKESHGERADYNAAKMEGSRAVLRVLRMLQEHMIPPHERKPIEMLGPLGQRKGKNKRLKLKRRPKR